MKVRQLDVLIIGAGIAGLSAAIALGKQGHRVVILEKSAFLKEAGAAIHLPLNCTALLQWMGVFPTGFGGTLLNQIHRYGSAGDLKYQKNFDGIRGTWQAEWYLVHRGDLHNQLKNRALETAILHTRCKITTIDINDSRPSVILDDGRKFDADVLLGADGLHSQVRGTVAPEAPGPYPVGKSCFRWILPTEKLKREESALQFVADPGVFIEWASEDRRLVAYPCSDNTVFNLCAFLPSSEVNHDGSGDSWQKVGKEADHCPRILKVPPWSAKNGGACWFQFEGHAALLGDAAHPFQPYMGQGGAMAIEDAVGIATLLPVGTRPEDIPTRLQLYQSSRQPRVEMVLNFTRLNGRDDNNTAGRRITPADMVKFMGICFSYNEIDQCKKLLAKHAGYHIGGSGE